MLMADLRGLTGALSLKETSAAPQLGGKPSSLSLSNHAVRFRTLSLYEFPWYL
jgi:hypothetical protein